VRVNAVSPGTIATEMQAKFLETGYASPGRYLSQVPMRRYGEPREIADAVHYLCSPWSSYITGAVLPVDGGWLANGLPAEAD
jgi:NAD(P)-dependent dehydrogenase (short-subunit alcohol dehydrogenase family)